MAEPDDPPSPTEIPDDLATLRVAPPIKSDGPDDLATIQVPKPVAAQPEPPQNAPSYAGANPDAAVAFTFGRRIAKGGMGAILEGDDCKLGRKIAVKVMLDPSASAEQTQRFVQEAAVLGRLEHPNIVPIHDLGRDSDRALYYTMKLVKGETLQHIIDRLRREDAATLEHYTLDRLLTIFRKVCDALAFAHAQNIIHRDLKPENIMVGEFGEVLVMDWGIAKILGEPGNEEASPVVSPQSTSGTASFTATMEGAVMGTPNYMSPEQAMGKVNELDEHSDIFSLGGILYAILTLRPPVEGKDVWEVLEKVQAANIASPTLFGATTGTGKSKAKSEVIEAKKITPLPHLPGGRVPPALSAVAMKALTLDKAKRYQSVAAFSADIEKYQGGYATSAEQAGLAKQLALLIKRNKGASIAAGVAAVLITVLSVGFMLKVNHEKGLAETEAVKARAAEAVALQKEDDARRSLKRSSISLAEAALREGNGTLIKSALDAVDDDLRDDEWHYLLREADSSLLTIDIDNEQIRGVAADPTRPGVFAFAQVMSEERGRIVVMNPRSGERLLEFDTLKPGLIQDLKLAYSQDGKRIAAGPLDGNRIAIYDSQDGTLLTQWQSPTPMTARLEFSPDGRVLLQTTVGQRLKSATVAAAWNSSTGKPLWTFQGNNVTQATFTPDGKEVAVILQFGSLAILSVENGSILRQFATKTNATAAALHPDGKSVILAELGGPLKVVSLQNGNTRFEIPRQQGRVKHMACGREWELVSIAYLEDGRQGIQVFDSNKGEKRHALLGGEGIPEDIALHPLSGELAIIGTQSKLYESSAMPKYLLGTIGQVSWDFWGTDELLLASGIDHFALYKQENDQWRALWKPDGPDFAKNVSISSAGSFALVAKQSPSSPVMLLRGPAPNVEFVNEFKFHKWITKALLHPQGDRFLCVSGSWFAEVASCRDGSVLAKLETSGSAQGYQFNDQGWLPQTNEIIGLETTNGLRGEPDSVERVVVWDAKNGKVVRAASHSSPMNVLAISPDGKRFAEAGTDKKVRIRNSETLAIEKEFRAHNDNITGMTWHPQKAILATASADLSLRLWDLESGALLEQVHGSKMPPIDLHFSPRGIRLIYKDQNVYRMWEPRSLWK